MSAKIARQRRENIEADQIALLDEAAAAYGEATEETERRLKAVRDAIAQAHRVEKEEAIADRRLLTALGMLEFLHGVEGRRDAVIASRYAASVYTSILRGAELRGDEEPRNLAAKQTRGSLCRACQRSCSMSLDAALASICHIPAASTAKAVE